jgi:DNA mismatch repair protein MutS
MSKADVTTEERHGIPAGREAHPDDAAVRRRQRALPGRAALFRMGDFYEMFYADAEVGGVSRPDRHQPRQRVDGPRADVRLSASPAPAYLAKALAAGLKVAVCDQLEDPAMAKGIVERGITRVVTPGVVLDAESLEARVNNFLVAVVPGAQRGPVGAGRARCLDG